MFLDYGNNTLRLEEACPVLTRLLFLPCVTLP